MWRARASLIRIFWPAGAKKSVSSFAFLVSSTASLRRPQQFQSRSRSRIQFHFATRANPTLPARNAGKGGAPGVTGGIQVLALGYFAPFRDLGSDRLRGECWFKVETSVC